MSLKITVNTKEELWETIEECKDKYNILGITHPTEESCCITLIPITDMERKLKEVNDKPRKSKERCEAYKIQLKEEREK